MDTWLDDDDSIGQHEASGASSSSSTSAALPDTRPVKGVQFMRKDSWLDMEDFARSTGKSSNVQAQPDVTDPLTTLIGSIGPQNAEELVLSPLDFVTTLCEKEEAAFQQFVNNMQNLGFHSHFSGCNFDYMATMFIREALLHLGMSIPLPTYLHACDVGSAQLRCLASLSPEKGGAQHIFRNMWTRLPAGVQEECLKHEPLPMTRKDDPDLAEIMYMRISQTLEGYFKDSFDLSAKAKCYRHGGLCPVYAPVDPGLMVLHSSGLICKDHSSFGTMLRLSGPSTKLFSLWKWEQNEMNWTFYVVECARALSGSVITAGFRNAIVWVSICLQPEWFGAPIGRRRRFTIGWDTTRVKMRKPISVQMLLSLFGRTIAMNPMDLFVATKEDLACEVQRLAARLQIGFSLEEVSTLASGGALQVPVNGISTFLELLAMNSPGDASRAEELSRKRAADIEAGKVKSGHYITDITQSAKRMRVGTKVLPTLCTSTKFRSSLHSRDMLAREHLIAQGVRGWKSDGLFQLPWAEEIDNIGESAIRTLAGNGQHVCVVVPIHLCLLGFAEPVEVDIE